MRHNNKRMTEHSAIQKPKSASAAETPPLQKLCREVLYGIKGLENYTDEDSDKLLVFFDKVIGDLEEPSYTGDNQLPLIRELVGSEEEQEKIRGDLEDLSEFADEIRDIRADERGERISDDDIEEALELANEIYKKLDLIQEQQEHTLV